MNVASGRQIDDDDVIVDRAHVAQHFSKIVHLLVVLRNEIEQIGIERESRCSDDRDDGNDHRGENDLFAPAETEFSERVEDSFDQSDGG